MTLVRMRSLAISTAVLVAALLLSHELIYWAAHGAELPQVMSARGHDAYWLPYVLAVASAALLVALATTLRLQRLTRLVAASTDPSIVARVETTPFLPAVGRTWLRLSIATMVLFVLQENVELLLGALPLPGLTVLAEAGGMPILLIAGVAFVVSLLVAAARRRHELLLTCLAAIRLLWPRSRATRRRQTQDRAVAVRDAASRRGRAPPIAAIG